MFILLVYACCVPGGGGMNPGGPRLFCCGGAWFIGPCWLVGMAGAGGAGAGSAGPPVALALIMSVIY